MTDKARTCSNCANMETCQLRIRLDNALHFGREFFYLQPTMTYARIAPVIAERCDHYEEDDEEVPKQDKR